MSMQLTDEQRQHLQEQRVWNQRRDEAWRRSADETEGRLAQIEEMITDMDFGSARRAIQELREDVANDIGQYTIYAMRDRHFEQVS